MTRHGERLAAVEVKCDALKGDMEHVRASMHGVNNELQKIVIAEEACKAALSHIRGQVDAMVAAAPSVNAVIEEFRGMRSDLREVIDGWKRQQGSRAMLLAFNRVLPWVVAIVTGAAWAWEHFLAK